MNYPPPTWSSICFMNKRRKDAGEFDDWEEELQSNEELDTSHSQPEEKLPELPFNEEKNNE